MSKKEERIKEYETDLKEFKDWVEGVWMTLPRGVKNVLVVGQIQLEDRIIAMKNDYL